MIPDKFNMVDMDGIDLIMMQGEEVPGLYMRLVESIAQCRYQCLYNWFFDGVVIPPSYVEMEVNEDDEVAINEGVTVSPDDVLHIYSIEPTPVDPDIIPLLAEENGIYTVPAGKDGFNPVTVDVPSYTPVIESLSVTENGTYTAPAGKDGYSPVTVNVPSSAPVIESLSVTENGTYTAPAGKDGYNPVTVNVPSVASKYLLQTPLHYDFIGGYVGQAVWYVNDTNARTDIYQVYAGKHYMIHLGSIVGNRFRCAFFNTDPALATATMNGTGIFETDNPSQYAITVRYTMFTPSSDGFVAIGKTNQQVNGLISYLVAFEESN